MNVNLYLHIGDGKTGTSAIQNFLDVNRELLFKEHGYLYPNFLETSYEKGRYHNHSAWFGGIDRQADELISELKPLHQYCMKRVIHNVIMSNEGWMGRYRPRMNMVVKGLLQDNPGFQVKIICYVRRPDSWLESYWKQWGIKKFADIDSFLADRENDRGKNVLQVLEAWEEVVGRENIIVRPYEKQQLKGGLIADFLAAVGIQYDQHDWSPVEKTNLAMNVGFRRDVLEVLHMCRELAENRDDNRIFELFYDLLPPKFHKQPFEQYELFSPMQKLTILKKNEPMMAEIARRYLGREDGKLFYEPWPLKDDTWQPYEGLTLNKLVPILIQLVYSQQQEINQLKQKVLGERGFLEKQVEKLAAASGYHGEQASPAAGTPQAVNEQRGFKQKFKRSFLYRLMRKIYRALR